MSKPTYQFEASVDVLRFEFESQSSFKSIRKIYEFETNFEIKAVYDGKIENFRNNINYEAFLINLKIK
jgi:hypothetical protein